MTRRKGELSAAQLDREFPFQVALPADRVGGQNYETVQIACAALGAAPRTHSIRRDDRDFIVFCFAEESAANGFKATFGGETCDPKDRGRGRTWFRWGK